MLFWRKLSQIAMPDFLPFELRWNLAVVVGNAVLAGTSPSTPASNEPRCRNLCVIRLRPKHHVRVVSEFFSRFVHVSSFNF